MKRDTLRSFQSMLRILLIAWMLVSARQELIAAAGNPFVEQNRQNAFDTDAQIIPEVRTVQLIGLCYTPEQKEAEKPKNKIRESISGQFLRKIQLLVIGGGLLIIGAFFIPHLIPQFTSYPEKLYRFFENTVKTYKMIFQNTQGRRQPRAASVAPFAEKQNNTHKHVLVLEHKETAMQYYALRCKNSLTPACELSIPKPANLGIVRKFFQQSGFAFTKISDSELWVNSSRAPYQSYAEIPVYLVNEPVLDRSSIQHIYDKLNTQRQQLERKNGQGEIVFTVSSTAPDESAYQQIYNYRIKHNCTIIPLSHSFVTKSVRSASCARELEEKVRISTKQCNLYAMHPPVADSLGFFGRDDVLAQLHDAVKRQKQMSLCALRKMGKTWLTWQFKEQLAQHIAIYIDLHRFTTGGAELYHSIIAEGVREVNFKYPELELPDLYWRPSNVVKNTIQEFERDLLTIGACLSAKHNDVKIILLLDGAEQLVATSLESSGDIHKYHDFLTTIRSISQQHNFLVSIMVFASPTQNTSEWLSDQKIFLTSLAEEDCNCLINAIGAQMGLTYTEESLSRLYYETGGHPYVTRQLCSLIVKNRKRAYAQQWKPDSLEQTIVQVRDVEEAVTEYLEYKSEYLEQIWQQCSRIEQELMSMIVAKHSCTLDELMNDEYEHQTGGDRSQAIAALIENDLIERCEDKYSMKMGLFERLILTKN